MSKVRDYEATHKTLLEVAFKMFLEKGFKNTKIREICREAKLTTGAFYKHFDSKDQLFVEIIDPFITNLQKIYDDKLSDVMEEMTDTNIVDVWEKNILDIQIAINFLYDHYDYSKLLLFKSEGSSYSDIPELLTTFSEKKIMLSIEQMKKKEIIEQDFYLSPKEIHFYSFSFYATCYDILKHQYDREETISLCKKLYSFFYPSWIKLFNLK